MMNEDGRIRIDTTKTFKTAVHNLTQDEVERFELEIARAVHALAEELDPNAERIVIT